MLQNLKDLSPVVVAIISCINLFMVFKVYLWNKQNSFSKLSVMPLKKDNTDRLYHPHDFDRAFYSENIEEFKKKGFPDNIKHDPFTWSIKVSNRGDLSSTNVVVKYTLVIQKYTFEYGMDEADVINEKLVEYKRYKREEKIPYIGADEEKEIDVISIYGKFPNAELILEELKSDQRTFISKPVSIDKYEHPEFQWIQDSYHHRRLIGANRTDEQ